MHANINRQALSLKLDGGKIESFKNAMVVMRDCDLKVAQSTHAKIFSGEHRSVCARVHGTVVNQEPVTAQILADIETMTEVSYNPREFDIASFYVRDTKTPISQAKVCVLVASDTFDNLTKVRLFIQS
tara:strand:- start:946 stop:1329 length:384 start_codon:yes stop_codon:yes gene_type:complete